MSGDLTLVSLSWRKKRRNHRLLFGVPRGEIRLDWQRNLAVFAPGDLFAYERWEASKYGTTHWSICVLQAGAPGDHLTALQGLKPGAILLAKRSGKRACTILLSEFDRIRKTKPLESVRANDWCQIGNHLAVGLDASKTIGRILERC